MKYLTWCVLLSVAYAAPADAQHNGAVARCNSGAVVFLDTGSQTCASAGGVAEWYVTREVPAPVSEQSSAPIASESTSYNGAVARCLNGLYVFRALGSKTCAEAGGVAQWFSAQQSNKAFTYGTSPTIPGRTSTAELFRSPPANGILGTQADRATALSDVGSSYPALYPQTQRPRNSSTSAEITYDSRSGNFYNWQHLANGDTKVNGLNVQTGSIWNTTIKPNGSMNGMDSGFNPWTYDANSKIYINFGTGRICTGEGLARVCSGDN